MEKRTLDEAAIEFIVRSMRIGRNYLYGLADEVYPEGSKEHEALHVAGSHLRAAVSLVEKEVLGRKVTEL